MDTTRRQRTEDPPALRLIEHFASVQGETSYAGLPTTFIRLAACNLRCSWCDTPYSFGRGQSVPLSEILDQVERYGLPYVCVTGGEPLLQRAVCTLMQQLCDKGYRVSLETGGSLTTEPVDPRVKVILDVKCPGSGMAHKNLWDNLDRLRRGDEVKFVLAQRDDYDWAVRLCRERRLHDKVDTVLFAPVFGVLDAKELVGWIVADRLPVRLNLQIHKFIWSPETKGV